MLYPKCYCTYRSRPERFIDEIATPALTCSIANSPRSLKAALLLTLSHNLVTLWQIN